ncbi:MAG: hypothetical protein AAB445_00370 [Patescibacteria group bacterium]
MTRVDPAPPVAPQAASRFPLPLPRFSLGRLIKLAVLVGIVWVLVQIARTGVWTIPVISNFAYDAPMPLRTVQAAAPSTGDMLARVPNAVTAGSLTVYEAELSLLAEQGNQKLRLGLAKVQTVISEGRIELSFLLPQRNNAVVRLELEPSISPSGDPDFRVVRSRLGLLDVPQWLIGEPARRLLQLQMQPVATLLPKLAQARAVEGALAYTLATP